MGEDKADHGLPVVFGNVFRLIFEPVFPLLLRSFLHKRMTLGHFYFFDKNTLRHISILLVLAGGPHPWPWGCLLMHESGIEEWARFKIIGKISEEGSVVKHLSRPHHGKITLEGLVCLPHKISPAVGKARHVEVGVRSVVRIGLWSSYHLVGIVVEIRLFLGLNRDLMARQ